MCHSFEQGQKSAEANALQQVQAEVASLKKLLQDEKDAKSLEIKVCFPSG
jgi:hypothetical protein